MGPMFSGLWCLALISVADEWVEVEGRDNSLVALFYCIFQGDGGHKLFSVVLRSLHLQPSECKPSRHGLGINLRHTDPSAPMCFYVGHWFKGLWKDWKPHKNGYNYRPAHMVSNPSVKAGHKRLSHRGQPVDLKATHLNKNQSFSFSQCWTSVWRLLTSWKGAKHTSAPWPPPHLPKQMLHQQHHRSYRPEDPWMKPFSLAETQAWREWEKRSCRNQ